MTDPVTAGLRATVAAALDGSIDGCARCKTCDRQVDAVMAAIGDEAVERMAEQFVNEMRVRSIDFRNGMDMDLEPSKTLVAHWVAAARGMLAGAPNYVEMEVGLAGEGEHYVFRLQRKEKLTPHALRKQAEARAQEAETRLEAVREWLNRQYSDYPDLWAILTGADSDVPGQITLDVAP